MKNEQQKRCTTIFTLFRLITFILKAEEVEKRGTTVKKKEKRKKEGEKEEIKKKAKKKR